MNEFYLQIITPERTFYSGKVQSITVNAIGGRCTIMALHQPIVLATEPGVITITANGVSREAFLSEGFLEVRPDETVVFSQAGEWPEEINEQRAKEAKERAEEMIRRTRSASEYRLNRAALQRAFARLRVKNEHYKH